MKKENSGITLLALIITIIIMLILAGVTISIVGGSDGIVAKAEKAVSQTDKAAQQEDAELSIAAIKMDYYEDYAANRAKYANAKAFIVDKLQTAYTTSRGAIMTADSEGNVIYTYKGVAIELTMNDNGEIVFGEDVGDSEEEVEETEKRPVSGLYQEDGNFIPWATLIGNGTLTVTDGEVMCNNKTITGNLVIDESVTSLGENAFNDTNLSVIDIPGSVKGIGGYFDGCDKLKEVILREGVEKILGEYAFRESSVETLVIPSTMTDLGIESFYYCRNLCCCD